MAGWLDLNRALAVEALGALGICNGVRRSTVECMVVVVVSSRGESGWMPCKPGQGKGAARCVSIGGEGVREGLTIFGNLSCEMDKVPMAESFDFGSPAARGGAHA